MTEHNYDERPLIYVAGPYTNPDPVENTRNAIDVADRLLNTGLVTPVIPHLSLLWHLAMPKPLEFWYPYDLAILRRCDGLLRMPGSSSGADAEARYAVKHDIPVFHTVQALHDWVRGS